MKITDVRIYDIEETITESGLAKSANPEYSLERASSLAFAPVGSGHDCFLKGIIVRHRLQADHSFWMQWQRYHFHDVVTSESKMHCITSMELKWHPFVFSDTRELLSALIKDYNNYENFNEDSGNRILRFVSDDCEIKLTSKQDLFEAIILNCPLGLEITASVVTNYLQLKTIHSQRRPHRMSSWQQYCDWIETLPLQTLITVHK